MPNISPGSAKPPQSIGQSKGFVLLEVLVAMTLVATSWISLGNTYQKLVLGMGQVREKRVQIQKELDQHEIAQAEASKVRLPKEGVLNESIGMSRRIRPVPHLGRTIIKK
ncbi:prepilin-type N-terminal cleavage/methylation domain-containing protein [Polynucleobacter sp. AP-Nino-20-G2]|uniref:prepilin-type N-terminal cleavage/methylation domain-containing protein n=1 Tax=Polynucleobacter sp. AP-Nino-20-G2 TaxID=2576917 RepID=UPI001BFD648E|nr:prepilin-type N-terminal cleavage/methylation domain-containing protein [Polynucleobacter sp. AP-Nino-20-G2]QWE16901.1 prepilin-type N-terminal cleavage/methylation domain-containing protein [Polynucleobacter sp. AP-Nino-20-G2]